MKLFLLPTSFKKVGIVLFIITLLLSIISIFADYTYHPQQKSLIKQLLISLFCLALFFLNFYRHKNEDTTLLKIRMQCLIISFFFVIKYLVLLSLIHVLDGDGLPHTASEIIVLILLFNLCMMYGMTQKVKPNTTD
nr:hypothetical protein [uncultured Flavobacterium sp.]